MSVEWYVRCESNSGAAGGIGHVREQELVESLRHFGIQDVETLNYGYTFVNADNRELQDSMTAEWDSSLIWELVMERVGKYTIDTVSP
jgi:hypothetical protein